MEKNLNLLGIYRLILKDKIYIFICILIAILLKNLVFTTQKIYESKVFMEANISPTALLNRSTNGLINNNYYYDSIYRQLRSSLFYSDNFEVWKKLKLTNDPNFKTVLNFENLAVNSEQLLKIKLNKFPDRSLMLSLKSPKINNVALTQALDYFNYTNKTFSYNIKKKHIDLIKQIFVRNKDNADCKKLIDNPAEFLICISKKDVVGYDTKYYNVFFKSDEWINDPFYLVTTQEPFKLVTMAPIFQNILSIIISFFIGLIIIFTKATFKNLSED